MIRTDVGTELISRAIETKDEVAMRYLVWVRDDLVEFINTSSR